MTNAKQHVGLRGIDRAANAYEPPRVSNRADLVAENLRLRREIRGLQKDLELLKREALRLRVLSFLDELTGMPNRRLFHARLDSLLDSKGAPRRFALLFIDLDDFKRVNDSAGHGVGDMLLTSIALSIDARVRLESDACPKTEEPVVARYGGDEFVVILPGIPNECFAMRMARSILERVNDPFTVCGRTLSVTASIGVAIHPDDGGTAKHLIRSADEAMYRAKRDGKRGCAFRLKPVDGLRAT